MSDKDKYYIDGYGTKRPKDVPFGILKTLSRVLNGAAIADFVTSDRVTTVDDGY